MLEGGVGEEDEVEGAEGGTEGGEEGGVQLLEEVGEVLGGAQTEV